MQNLKNAKMQNKLRNDYSIFILSIIIYNLIKVKNFTPI